MVPLPLGAQSEDEDRGYLQGLIEDALSGAGREVRIEGFAGALSSTATLASLTIADADGVWLTMTNAQLDWRRAALLRGRLEVNALTAEALTISRLPTAEPVEETGFELPDLPPPQATAFALPELPVSIQVGEVGIETVTLGEPVMGEPAEVSLKGSASLADGEGETDLTIERLDGPEGAFGLAGSFANSTGVLSISLTVSEERNGLVATLVDLPDRPSLDLSIVGDGPLSDFGADIVLATDGVERLRGLVETGTTEASSGAAEQFFGAELAGDIRPLLKPDYRTFFGESLSLDIDAVRTEQGGLDIPTLALQSASINLNGQLSLGPESWPTKIDVRGRIAPLEGDSVLLTLPGPPTRLGSADLSFAFDAASGDRWDLELAADRVQRDGFALGEVGLRGQGRIAAGEGDAVGQVSGALDLGIEGLDLGDADLTAAVGSDLSGSLSFALVEDQPFELTSIDMTGADYGLKGDITVSIPEGTQSPLVTTDLAVAARDISRFANLAGQPISGGVGVDVLGDIIPLDGAFDLQVSGMSSDLAVGISQVDPLIGGAGSLEVQARRDSVGTFLDRFDIQTPQARIQGSTEITGSSLLADVSARILDASLVHPDMVGEGQITAQISQEGPRLNAAVSARAPGNTQLQLDLETPEGSSTSQLDAKLQSEDLSVFAWTIDRPLGGRVDLTATGEGDLEALSGSLRMNGTAANVFTGLPEVDALLSGVVEFLVDASRASDGTISLASLDVTAPRISANANGEVLGTDGQLAYRVALPNFGVLFPALPGPLNAEGTLASRSDAFDIVSEVNGPGGMQMSLSGEIAADATTANLSATGAVPLSLANRQIAPNIVEGSLGFDMGVQGPISLSSVTGTLTTRGATLSLPAQKLAFDSIDSTVGLSSGRANIDANVSVANGGALRISGPVNLSAPFSGDLTVLIDDMGVVEPGLLQTVANGRISASGPLTGGAQISGQINFEEVGIQVPSSTGAASAALPGLQHVNEPGAVRQSRDRAGLIETQSSNGGNAPPYGLDVLISAPSRIFIRGRGLDAEMGGSLRIAGTTNNVIPTGRFELIRGRLNILGQRVDLTEGYIEPQGDLDPYMEIIAEASSGEIDVRFVIEGPISAPELTMTSSPELPEDEILSQFLFGRDLTEISALQALRIADAISQLSGRGPGAVGSVRAGLGLDNLDVETTESGETSVRAGKYISDNIYSDVSRSSEGETEINLNLSITPSLTARGTARTDSSTSVGVFLERDY